MLYTRTEKPKEQRSSKKFTERKREHFNREGNAKYVEDIYREILKVVEDVKGGFENF